LHTGEAIEIAAAKRWINAPLPQPSTTNYCWRLSFVHLSG
jgi:hypothetical protein